MPTATELEQAFTAGTWAREAGRERVPPTYAIGELGRPQRERWLAGYDSKGPLAVKAERNGEKCRAIELT
jgi:hypothetical protein